MISSNTNCYESWNAVDFAWLWICEPILVIWILDLKSSWFNCFTSLLLGACRELEWCGMSIIIIPFHTENCVGFILNFLIAFSCMSMGQYHQVSFTLGLGVRLYELDVSWNMIFEVIFWLIYCSIFCISYFHIFVEYISKYVLNIQNCLGLVVSCQFHNK